MVTKKSKKENLKGMSESELGKRLKDLRESVRVIHFKGEGSKSKNVRENRSLKRDIARVLTQMNAK